MLRNVGVEKLGLQHLLGPWEGKEREIAVEILDILPAEEGMENSDIVHST